MKSKENGKRKRKQKQMREIKKNGRNTGLVNETEENCKYCIEAINEKEKS